MFLEPTKHGRLERWRGENKVVRIWRHPFENNIKFYFSNERVEPLLLCYALVRSATARRQVRRQLTTTCGTNPVTAEHVMAYCFFFFFLFTPRKVSKNVFRERFISEARTDL